MVIACTPKAEVLVALIGFSLVLGWMLCAMFIWRQEDRERERRRMGRRQW